MFLENNSWIFNSSNCRSESWSGTVSETTERWLPYDRHLPTQGGGNQPNLRSNRRDSPSKASFDHQGNFEIIILLMNLYGVSLSIMQRVYWWWCRWWSGWVMLLFIIELDLRLGGSLAQSVLFLGKIIYLHFLTQPRCKWVPILLGKFPETDWRPVLGWWKPPVSQTSQ